jgi:hypothetical protein
LHRGSVVVALFAVIAACADGQPAEITPGPLSTTTTTVVPKVPAPAGDPSDPSDPVVLAAGDIAACESSGDEATAEVLESRPSAAVVTLGDNVYDNGTAIEFARCYDPSWGRAKARTRPAPGNHDYGTEGAAAYFRYFGAAAGEPGKGYYSYDLGGWHVVALNSNCSVVSCAEGSAQERWLRSDLVAHPVACTLAYWHHPRFSSGSVHGSNDAVAPLWRALFDAGADVVLSGHEHHYERLAPLGPSGRPDRRRGIRSFVVGTGGRSHYGFGFAIPGSQVRHSGTFGVLELTLRADGYSWEFLPEAGESFTDSGSDRCH